MKKAALFMLPWLAFVSALYLCYSTLEHIPPSRARYWEPAFYSFLPMCFFFAGAAIYVMGRDIRELKKKIAELEAGPNALH
jgi:hypothetical protein